MNNLELLRRDLGAGPTCGVFTHESMGFGCLGFVDE
jgi:hypothetical protein